MRQALGPGALGGPEGSGWGEPKAFSFQCMTKFTTKKKEKRKKELDTTE